MTLKDILIAGKLTISEGGGGGGDIGGLANMADVNTQDYQLAYMLMKMKKGETKGGTITYTEAFPNTETKILETGLDKIHGVMFVATGIDNRNTGGNGNASYKWLILTVNSDDTYNAVGMAYTSNTNALGKPNLTQGVQDNVPQGAFTFTGGDVYYTARYNKNEKYQCVIKDEEYDWLAW